MSRYLCQTSIRAHSPLIFPLYRYVFPSIIFGIVPGALFTALTQRASVSYVAWHTEHFQA